MNITKYGHCCLLIEIEGVRILTDPGVYSEGQEEASKLDCILISHEHSDHLHIESLQKILEKNPETPILTNLVVAPMLDEAGIHYTLLRDGEIYDCNGVTVRAFEVTHAEVYKSKPNTPNTGFMIADQFFYPGDAFIDPGQAIDVLALPVAGPWMRLADAVDYALKLRPRVAIPVHDGMLKQPGLSHRMPMAVLEDAGIDFVVIHEGETKALS